MLQMFSLKGFCLKLLKVGILVVPVIAVMVGCDSRTKNGPRFTSYANLHKIGIAIRDYSEAEGQRPRQLSNLVPRYIPLGQIGIFYVTNSYAKALSAPPDWASNPSRIDQFGSYVYSGTNSAHGVLAYEKLDLWKASASHQGEVAVLFTDFHVQYLPVMKLQELIEVKVP